MGAATVASAIQPTRTPSIHSQSSNKSETHEIRTSSEDRVPDRDTVAKAGNCVVVNARRERFRFSDLHAPTQGESKKQRHLFIFVRHFFCGLCQDYIRELTRLIIPSSLSPNTKISIIGCGSPDLLSHYRRQTGSPYPLYTDETKRLFDTFAMSKNLSMGDKRPDYQTHTSAQMIAESLGQSLASGTKVFSGGAYNQLGGEMLFEDGEVTWCHRMRNTRDHTEIAVLKELLGVR